MSLLAGSLVLLAACGPSHVRDVMAKLGPPAGVERLASGDSVYVWDRRECTLSVLTDKDGKVLKLDWQERTGRAIDCAELKEKLAR